MPFLVQGCIDDHTLAVTTATAKEAFAKAVEWHVAERFADVSIYDGIKIYSIEQFFIGYGAPGDCEDRRGRSRTGAEGQINMSASLRMISLRDIG